MTVTDFLKLGTAPAPGRHFITQNYHLRLIVRATDAVQKQTPIVDVSAEQTDTYTPIQSNEDQFDATFDNAFILRSGQTANFPAGDLRITLHSIAPDSGCLDPWCDEMWLNASLSITTTDLQQSGAMIGKISPGTPYVFTLGDYSILGVKVEVLGEGPQATHELTLRVYTFVEEDSQSAISQEATPSSQTSPPPKSSTTASDDNLASSKANAVSSEDENTTEPSNNGLRHLLPASIIDAFDWLVGLFR